MTDYRALTRAQLDAAYDNSKAVTDSARLIGEFNERSARLRTAYPAHLDLRYGTGERNRIDYFAGGAGRPLLLFIHGGYWQMRAKETFSFLASGPLAHGMHVACMGYTLAPAITLAGIVAEVRAAVAWLAVRAPQLGADASRIYVSGWSAGGHLAACCLDEPSIRGGLAISGIYDLEPIRRSFLNEKLALSADDARALSPIHDVRLVRKPLIVAFGTAELPQLQRQSQEYARAREAQGIPGDLVAIAGRNHFTILEELAQPEGILTRRIVALAAVT